VSNGNDTQNFALKKQRLSNEHRNWDWDWKLEGVSLLVWIYNNNLDSALPYIILLFLPMQQILEMETYDICITYRLQVYHRVEQIVIGTRDMR
jgi:hypothetical protein